MSLLLSRFKPPSPVVVEASLNRLGEPLERLPFRIEPVATEEDLRDAVQVRQSAYARHLPSLAEQLGSPEPADRLDDTLVLLARSQLDGAPLGSIRIQTNAVRPLPLEASIDLPERLKRRHLAEATRLGVTRDPVGRLVTTALFKAFFRFAEAEEVQSMVVAARAGVDRFYLRLLFSEVFPERGAIPLRHAGMLPHRIFELDVEQVRTQWRAAEHPLCGFMFDTEHPDLRWDRRSVRRPDHHGRHHPMLFELGDQLAHGLGVGEVRR